MATKEEALVKLARQVEAPRYGKFRGVVTDNKDPQTRGRLRLRIPSVLGDQESDWALPCMPAGGGPGYGFFFVPLPDAQVWVEFEEGDIHRPIWTGVFWQQGSDVPQDAAKSEPTVALLNTPAGHLLMFEDKAGDETVRLRHAGGSELSIDKDGIVSLRDGAGSSLRLDAKNRELAIDDANGNSALMSSSGVTIGDANGNAIEMAASGISVKAQRIVVQGSQVSLGGEGGEPLIKGSSFLALFSTHIHPTGMGPSGPPVPQGEMSSLSTKTMTS